jgi:large subunit ribosomal protein L7/L12
VQELDKYIRQHENRIQGIKQRQKTADNSIRRKQDSKRKILMGALVEHLMETNKISKTFILDELDNFLIRDSDKALFSDYWSSEDLTLTSKE